MNVVVDVALDFKSQMILSHLLPMPMNKKFKSKDYQIIKNLSFDQYFVYMWSNFF